MKPRTVCLLLLRKARDGTRMSARETKIDAVEVSTLFPEDLLGRVSVHHQVKLVTPRQEQKHGHEGAGRSTKGRRRHPQHEWGTAFEAESLEPKLLPMTAALATCLPKAGLCEHTRSRNACNLLRHYTPNLFKATQRDTSKGN